VSGTLDRERNFATVSDFSHRPPTVHLCIQHGGRDARRISNARLRCRGHGERRRLPEVRGEFRGDARGERLCRGIGDLFRLPSRRLRAAGTVHVRQTAHLVHRKLDTENVPEACDHRERKYGNQGYQLRPEPDGFYSTQRGALQTWGFWYTGTCKPIVKFYCSSNMFIKQMYCEFLCRKLDVWAVHFHAAAPRPPAVLFVDISSPVLTKYATK